MTAYQRVYGVQCRTMAVLRELFKLADGPIATRGEDTMHPLYYFRVLPRYRCDRSKAIRNAVAARMRQIRRAA